MLGSAGDLGWGEGRQGRAGLVVACGEADLLLYGAGRGEDSYVQVGDEVEVGYAIACLLRVLPAEDVGREEREQCGEAAEGAQLLVHAVDQVGAQHADHDGAADDEAGGQERTGDQDQASAQRYAPRPPGT